MNSKPILPAWLIRLITWLFRLGVGGTFLFSGFVKAIDPWGTLYKFEEYLAALGLPMLHTLIVAGVFGLCALEFLIGFFIVFGCYRKSAPLLAMAFMCVMMPLTLWIAISDPVKDCGCFGDYLVISNWATFWKNVVLTAMILWLLKFNRTVQTVISPAFQWMAIVAGMAYIGYVSIYGYLIQPLLDFRPYPEGSTLLSEDNREDEESYRFVYEKDGVRKEFGENDDLPSEEEGWKFVERKTVTASNVKTENEDGDKSFRIWSRDGEVDFSDDVFGDRGDLVMLMIPDLADISPATTWKINALYDWATKTDAQMIGVVSGSLEDISEWENLSMPEYEIFTADDTDIKEVARGNPAVVYLKDGVIEWKETLSSIDVDSLTPSGKPAKASTFKTDRKRLLKNISIIYLDVIAFLTVLSMIPRIRNAYNGYSSRKDVQAVNDITHDGKAPREESSSPDKSAR